MAVAELVDQKGLPAHLLAERSVLGAVLLDHVAFHYAAEILAAEDFHLDSHARVFAAMSELAQANRAIDFITLGDALERRGQLEAVGGHAFLFALTEGLPRSVNVEHYARIVKDRSLLRQLVGAAQAIGEMALAGGEDSATVLDRAEKLIFDIASERVREGLTGVSELAPPLLRKLEEMQGHAIPGLATGYSDFDAITAGLQPSELIILAARPSMGKTAFAMNIAENVALREGKTVAIFSLEMSKVQLVLRLLCSVARVDNHHLRMGRLDKTTRSTLTQAMGQLAPAPLFIDDTSGIDLLTLRSKCRRLKAERGALDLVIIDYLQLMSTNQRVENRNLEISQLSRGLKALAKELQVPVIALSQLSRAPEQRPGKSREPLLSDLRESGSIEQDADLVAFIYREEMYNKDLDEHEKGKADIIIAKQRNGPTGRIHMAFLRQFTRFETLSELEPGDAPAGM